MGGIRTIRWRVGAPVVCIYHPREARKAPAKRQTLAFHPSIDRPKLNAARDHYRSPATRGGGAKEPRGSRSDAPLVRPPESPFVTSSRMMTNGPASQGWMCAMGIMGVCEITGQRSASHDCRHCSSCRRQMALAPTIANSPYGHRRSSAAHADEWRLDAPNIPLQLHLPSRCPINAKPPL